jgi:hypothetical protein
MTVQLSVAVRNARLDAIETTAGTSPKLRLYSGAAPANCAAARTGTLICEIALPSDWAANAASGSKALAGTWSGTGAAAAGTGTTVGHFALMDNAGTTCHMQGSVTVTGSGGDLTLDNASVAQNQAVNITSWTLTDANA